MSPKEPVRSVSRLDEWLICIRAILACFLILFKTRFSTIFNKCYNFGCPLRPFQYDDLYESAVLTEF